MSLDSACQLYVWAVQERRSCGAEVVTSIKLPAYTTLCLGVGGGVALQPRAESGHIQLAQGFGFTGTLEVGA